jgi:hypothetical protein
MASSPADRGTAHATASARAFALQEAIACWDQGYEALARGDLDGVGDLLDIADAHVANLGDASTDTADEARLRDVARSSRGRLEHGMKAGLQALGSEIANARRGAKVLRGYADPLRGIGGNVERSF